MERFRSSQRNALRSRIPHALSVFGAVPLCYDDGMKIDFSAQVCLPVIIGANAGAYGHARELHQQLGLCSMIICAKRSSQIEHTHIATVRELPDINEPAVLVELLHQLRNDYPSIPIILFATSDKTVTSILNNRHLFPPNVRDPYGNQHTLALAEKAACYRVSEQLNIPYARSYMLDQDSYQTFDYHQITYPVAVKASNQTQYDTVSFAGQKKVNKKTDAENTHSFIHALYGAGYENEVVVQEWIPGSDDCLYSYNVYIGEYGKILYESLVQVLVEEKTPTGQGNLNVVRPAEVPIIRAYTQQIITHAQLRGAHNLDFKYDHRSDTYNLLEINPRLGNSNHAAISNGVSFSAAITSHLLDIPYHTTLPKQPDKLTCIIPLLMIPWCVNGWRLRTSVGQSILRGNTQNILWYRPDLSFRRIYRLLRFALGYLVKYWRYYQ